MHGAEGDRTSGPEPKADNLPSDHRVKKKKKQKKQTKPAHIYTERERLFAQEHNGPNK